MSTEISTKNTSLIIRFSLLAAVVAWAVPLLCFMREEMSSDPVWRFHDWAWLIVILAIGFHVRAIYRFLLPFLRGGRVDTALERKFILHIGVMTSLSLLPLIWLISDPVVDFKSPEWRNWAYVFLSFHCLSIVVYEIFSQNLMKNRLRFAAFLTVIVFLFLSPISLLANTLRVLENHDPRSLAGPMYVSYDPIKTTLGEILYELASWHYVAFFTVLLLVALDTRTSLRKGKLLPAIYFLFFVTHSSGLLSAICNNMPPYFELSSSTREFIYETFPRSSKWLFESLIIYPPDGIAWGLHGMDRKEAKRSAISRRARYPARSPLEIYEW